MDVPPPLCATIDALVAWLLEARHVAASDLDAIIEVQGQLSQLRGQQTAHADRLSHPLDAQHRLEYLERIDKKGT